MMSQPYRGDAIFRYSLALVVVTGVVADLHAQMRVDLRTHGDELAAQVLAEAQVRQTDAETMLKLADAKSAWLDVELKQAQVFWEKRFFHKTEKQELAELGAATQLRNRRLNLAREWDLLQNHPEVAGPNIRNGRALNFLLDRLNVNLLAYGYALDNNPDAQAFLDDLRLTREMVHGINLRQTITVGGGSARFVVFPADGGEAVRIAYWPFLLRGSSFAAERDAVEAANRATTMSRIEDSVEIATQLTEAFDRLTKKFYETYPPRELRAADMQTALHFTAAERFLRSKRWEVSRSPLVMLGDQSQLRFDLGRDGDHLIALLTFMARNGLDFAPPSSGNEHVYVQMFHMMRDLFATDMLAGDLEGVSQELEQQMREARTK